jgi:hypothetical protein
MSTRTSLAALTVGSLACGALVFAACSSFSADPAEPPADSGPEASTPDASSPADGSAAPDAEADAAPSSAYRAAILADAPLAYWRMGIPKGASIPDETGHANALLLQGAGVTLGRPGATSDGDTAIAFDGLATYAIAENARAFDFPAKAPFTLECWARYTPLDGGTSFPTLFSAVSGFNANANGYIFYVVTSAAKVQFNYGATAIISGDMPAGSSWTHYAVTFDGTNATLLVNGAVIAKAPALGESSVRTSELGVAGRPQDSKGFPGDIDEVAIYDKALTVSQILEHIGAR